MKNENITVNWDKDLSSSVFAVNDYGAATLSILAGAKQFTLLAGPRKGAEPYRVAFQNCNDPSQTLFSVEHALRNGEVPKNVCGKANTVSHPGEIIFWALPRSFWDFQ